MTMPDKIIMIINRTNIIAYIYIYIGFELAILISQFANIFYKMKWLQLDLNPEPLSS